MVKENDRDFQATKTLREDSQEKKTSGWGELGIPESLPEHLKGDRVGRRPSADDSTKAAQAANTSSAQTPPSDLPTIGEILKKAREDLGLNITVLSEKLRLRPLYIQSMEEDRFDQLMEEVYIYAFLRKYATALRLDADTLVERLKILKEGGKEKSTSWGLTVGGEPLPKGSFRKRIPQTFSSYMVGGILLLFFLGGLWLFWNLLQDSKTSAKLLEESSSERAVMEESPSPSEDASVLNDLPAKTDTLSAAAPPPPQRSARVEGPSLEAAPSPAPPSVQSFSPSSVTAATVVRQEASGSSSETLEAGFSFEKTSRSENFKPSETSSSPASTAPAPSFEVSKPVESVEEGR